MVNRPTCCMKLTEAPIARTGRAQYVCTDCGRELTMELVMLHEADWDLGQELLERAHEGCPV